MPTRCKDCGRVEAKWVGRCPGCGAWGTMEAVEEKTPGRCEERAAPPAAVRTFSEVETGGGTRLATGLGEFDRVLGGGFLSGEVVLLSGDPGVGKSTLALALARAFGNVLYASGEESMGQILGRVARLGLDPSRLRGTEETGIERILAAAEGEKPDLLVLDSVQTLYSEDLPGLAGSVSQVRAVTEKTCDFAKRAGVPVLLVGHVTKEGDVAGPMLLSHLVDCVLLFEPDESGGLRILRASKNRFGSCEEAGFFALTERGIEEVPDPEAAFLAPAGDSVPGQIRFPAVLGSRVLLVEIEALVLPTRMVPPRRLVSGLEANRVAMILAVLERRIGLRLGEAEVFIKTAGGYRIPEPAADLPAALALASALADKPLPANAAAFGEVGLSGDLRGVRWASLRAREAGRRGGILLAPKGAGGECATLAEAIDRAGLA